MDCEEERKGRWVDGVCGGIAERGGEKARMNDI